MYCRFYNSYCYFIEMGVDILNPVQGTAVSMNPLELKQEYGQDLIFWGGGVDTQGTLPNGTPQEVKEDVRRNIEALAPGGGYVFNTVHNIQACLLYTSPSPRDRS